PGDAQEALVAQHGGIVAEAESRRRREAAAEDAGDREEHEEDQRYGDDRRRQHGEKAAPRAAGSPRRGFCGRHRHSRTLIASEGRSTEICDMSDSPRSAWPGTSATISCPSSPMASTRWARLPR